MFASSFSTSLNSQQTSLDVSYQKIPDWLICRRQIPPNWLQLLKAAHAHVADAVNQGVGEDCPKAAEFLQQNKHEMSYLKIKDLVQILTDSPGGSSGISVLGMSFSSSVLRRWRALQRVLEKNNLHIVDMSRWLCRLLHDKIPGLQRSVQAKQKQVQDCDKRKQELQRTAQEARCTYISLCDKYGLPSPSKAVSHAEDSKNKNSSSSSGDKKGGRSSQMSLSEAQESLLASACSEEEIRERILSYVDGKLPKKLDEAENLIQTHGQGMLDLYQSFRLYQKGSSKENEEDQRSKKENMSTSSSSPLYIFYIMTTKGNIPACDLLSMIASSSSSTSDGSSSVSTRDNKEASSISLDDPSMVQVSDDIDYSAFEIEIEAEGEDNNNSPSLDDTSASSPSISREEGKNKMVNEKKDENDKNKQLPSASSSLNKKRTKETLLESRVHRRQLLDDIYELHAFLNQRILESGGAGSEGSAPTSSHSKAKGKSSQGRGQMKTSSDHLSSLPQSLVVSVQQVRRREETRGI
ncbi:cdk5 regulatory subunit-associated protein 3, partial [Cystoisospora suis]